MGKMKPYTRERRKALAEDVCELFRCAYRVYVVSDYFSDARRDLERKDPKASRMLEGTLKSIEDMEEKCKIELKEVKEITELALDMLKSDDWKEAERLTRQAEDLLERKLREASECK